MPHGEKGEGIGEKIIGGFALLRWTGNFFFVQAKTVPPLPSLFLWSVPNFVVNVFKTNSKYGTRLAANSGLRCFPASSQSDRALKACLFPVVSVDCKKETKYVRQFEVVISVLSFGEWSCFGVSITFFAFWEWSGKKKDLHLAVEQEAPCLGQSLTWPKVAQIRLGPRRVVVSP